LKNKEIRCFWTGGWDSTFRVLYLVIVEKQTVLPFYIIDEKRASTKQEIEVIKQIRQKLNKAFPDAAERLLDTHISKRSDIKKYHSIRKQYKQIAKRAHLGIQYEWLARFAFQHQLNDVELCLTNENAGGDFDRLMRPETTGVGHNCKIKEEPDFVPLKLFRFFCFPLYHMKKMDMLNLAQQNNFLKLMKLTWYCHNPDINNKPCGECRPCLFAKKSGYIDKL
jgi:7-cyano-7-deazaguanine synthase in queuosine biosynthesis